MIKYLYRNDHIHIDPTQLIAWNVSYNISLNGLVQGVFLVNFCDIIVPIMTVCVAITLHYRRSHHSATTSASTASSMLTMQPEAPIHAVLVFL